MTDELGILGQRLTWAARGLALWRRVDSNVINGITAMPLVEALWRVGFRAAAFHREERDRPRKEDTVELQGRLVATLGSMATWSRRTHGDYGAIAYCLNGTAVQRGNLRGQVDAYTIVANDSLDELRAQRRKRDMQAVRQWCRSATLSMSHRVTRPLELACGYTASASKQHRGERTSQRAADAGSREWGETWLADWADHRDDILGIIEDIEGEDDDEPEIKLPMITEWSVDRASRSFRDSTGVGMDWIPPRLIRLLTKRGKRALANIFMKIEGRKRWPSWIRAVIEVARGKKSGGARLVGLAPTLYRRWSRIRYLDIRSELEARIARPFLAAAPGRGAQRAVEDASWECELAAARRQQSATTTVDFKQYYEQIEVGESMKVAKSFWVA